MCPLSSFPGKGEREERTQEERESHPRECPSLLALLPFWSFGGWEEREQEDPKGVGWVGLVLQQKFLSKWTTEHGERSDERLLHSLQSGQTGRPFKDLLPGAKVSGGSGLLPLSLTEIYGSSANFTSYSSLPSDHEWLHFATPSLSVFAVGTRNCFVIREEKAD